VEAVEVKVLGSLELSYGLRRTEVRGQKQRAVIATLAASARRVVTIDALLDAVWGDDHPDGAEHALQQQISTARKTIASIGHPDPAAVLTRRDPGYCLVAAAVDSDRFETAAAAGFAATTAGQPSVALAAFDEALAQWRGRAFEDASDSTRLAAAATRLESQRVAVIEARFDTMLALGRANEIVAELEAIVKEHPLREAFHRQLMLSLYRSGRQADALAAFQAARRILIDELGIEPSAELRHLEQAILEQDPSLESAPLPDEADLFETVVGGGSRQPAYVVLPDGRAVSLPDGTVLIGRDSQAQICLKDSRVSRRHAEMVGAGRSWTLRDLASTNGTFLNGQRPERDLADGDTLDIGGVRLMFHLD